MGDKLQTRSSKKRGLSSREASSSCRDETSSHNLESEKARLNDLIRRLKDGNYWVPGPSGSLEILNGLVDSGFLLLRAVFEAIEKERTRLTTTDVKKLRKAQRESEAAILDLKRQHETEITIMENEKSRLAMDQAAVIEGLTVEQDETLQALEMEKEKNLCQICYERPRDSVVLTCMHHHYCGDCLEIYKRTSSRCPTCRGVISGICKLNH